MISLFWNADHFVRGAPGYAIVKNTKLPREIKFKKNIETYKHRHHKLLLLWQQTVTNTHRHNIKYPF